MGGLALAMALSAGFAAIGPAYLLINLLYSLWLKHVAIVDVLLVSLGFVCIAGAGAAGISIALTFLGCKERLIVLEAEGMEYSEDSQAIYRGELVGCDYYALDAARLRYFGGTTNHWEGASRPLDPLDFVARPWVPHSGWPIDPDDLKPYRDEAHRMLDLGPPVYEPQDLFPRDRLLSLQADRLVHCIWRGSPPTRFNEKYRQALEQADNVTVLLNASVTDIVLAEDLRRIDEFEITAQPSGRQFTVRATRAFVLALGGLENPRLLLNADRQISVGIGNEHDLGRAILHGAPGG
jgi:choline dehydrogenase-like flavoprotein